MILVSIGPLIGLIEWSTPLIQDISILQERYPHAYTRDPPPEWAKSFANLTHGHFSYYAAEAPDMAERWWLSSPIVFVLVIFFVAGNLLILSLLNEEKPRDAR